LLLVALGAFFAGSETGVYRLSRFRLRLGIEHKKPFYDLLGETMADSAGVVFSMLIGTNLAHYLVTSIVTVMLLSRVVNTHTAEFYATIIIAPVLFVFSEVIPKNLYYYRADFLMPRFAPVLWFFHKIFTYSGGVGLLKIISRTFTGVLRLPTDIAGAIALDQPGHIKRIIHETHDEGFLSQVQGDIMNRLINVQRISIVSVMTPITRTEMLDVNSTRAEVMTKLGRCPYTRLPVYEHSNNITGFVNLYEVLQTNAEFDNLRSFVKPIAQLNATTPVIDAINEMRSQNHKIVLVVPDYTRRKRPFGIVTMKDLVEELTGELAQW
jgi:CBS domain containing-hemolysin-like protein